MVSFVKVIVKRVVSTVFRLACKLGIVKPGKVVLIDGGICSQILQYYQGTSLSPDVQAEFDKSFWDSGGKDVLGNLNRPFEMLQIFPNLSFLEADRRKASFYRRYLQATTEFDQPPVYVNNYRFGISLKGLHDVFNLDVAVVPIRIKELMNTIHEEHSCGVHIRRGDLSNNDNPYYGVFSEEYLLKAIDFVKNKDEEAKFYVFSDDLDWVKTCFVSKCSVPLSVVEGNTGGEDLILLANCKYIVASQGTAGRLAALINGESLLLMNDGDPHNKSYLEAHTNCLVLSNDNWS